MTINSRRKGVTGEQKAVNYFKKHGWEAQRNPVQDSYGLTDISASKSVIKTAPEIKRVKSLPVFYKKAYAQAEKGARPGEIPLVMARENRGEWMIHLKADDFVKLVDMIANREEWS